MELVTQRKILKIMLQYYKWFINEWNVHIDLNAQQKVVPIQDHVQVVLESVAPVSCFKLKKDGHLYPR